MLVPAASLALVPLAGTQVAVLILTIALAGFGLGLCQPLTLSWVAARAPADIRGTAMGLRLSGNRLGQFALPVLAGLVAGAAGLPAIFWSIGVLLAFSAALVTSKTFGEE